MNRRLVFIFAVLVFSVATWSCFMVGTRSPEYEFQPGQEMSLAKTYDEKELPAGAGTEDVIPMGQVFTTSKGHEIKLVTEYNRGVIDINIKFADEPEKIKFQINTGIDPTVEWEDFEITPFLRGASDGKYHFWLYIKEK